MDKETSEIIKHIQHKKLDSSFSCGLVRGLLLLAKKNLQVKTIGLISSGNTARSGDTNRVIGYGVYVI